MSDCCRDLHQVMTPPRLSITHIFGVSRPQVVLNTNSACGIYDQTLETHFNGAFLSSRATLKSKLATCIGLACFFHEVWHLDRTSVFLRRCDCAQIKFIFIHPAQSTTFACLLETSTFRIWMVWMPRADVYGILGVARCFNNATRSALTSPWTTSKLCEASSRL